MKNYLVKASLLAVLACGPISIAQADTQDCNPVIESQVIESQAQPFQGESELDEDEIVFVDDNELDDALFVQAVKNTEPVSTCFYTESITRQINGYRLGDLCNSYLLAKQEAIKSKELEKEVAVEPAEQVTEVVA